MKKYRKRVVDDLLARKLLGMGAVLVQGAKWCGKTTTCEEFAKSALYMADPDTKESNLQMADIDIKALLKGEKPRLIDEWQIAPKFWDAVRYHVDHSDGFGHFILTGSAVPPDTKEIAHSGTGRIARVTMRPMSLWESGESNGSVSLGGLLTGKEFTSVESPDHRLEDVAFMVCRGGWRKPSNRLGKLHWTGRTTTMKQLLNPMCHESMAYPVLHRECIGLCEAMQDCKELNQIYP